MSEPMAIDQTGSEETYELRGVLLHKGPSAYHGHYMAKVFDVSWVARVIKWSTRHGLIVYDRAKQWYLFNDETVTPLRSLHKPAPIATINDDSDDVVEVIEPWVLWYLYSYILVTSPQNFESKQTRKDTKTQEGW